jgi:hypothetical protein
VASASGRSSRKNSRASLTSTTRLALGMADHVPVEAMQKANEHLNRGVTGEYRSDPQTIV